MYGIALRLFEQPLVPVVTTKGGEWVPLEGQAAFAISLKPGGHGAIWKLMHDQGVFTWLGAKGRKGAVVRQITNPMAGTDTTLLALSGVGRRGDKALGFASCERHLGASEGVNVLVERVNEDDDDDDASRSYSYGISNVEYTVLQQRGISDEPVAPGSSESAYPANTNVLYIGLEKIRDALRSSPRGAFPGLLVNLSKPAHPNGCKGGRLETSMQNIADALMHTTTPGDGPLPMDQWENLPTFVLYTLRRRITSSAKKKRDPANPNLAQTPEGSFLDLLKNASDLLARCDVAHPDPDAMDVAAYLKDGPSFIFSANPAIGPLWDVTSQKIRGGALRERAEVRLEIAEIEWKDVDVDGSFLITADAPFGEEKVDDDAEAARGKPTSFDDDACGRCRLRGVAVRNAGVDWSAPDDEAWSATLTRSESCVVRLRGNAEFDARDVTLSGDVMYDVPAGWRLSLRPDTDERGGESLGAVREEWTDLSAAGGGPTWRWAYDVGDGGRVGLRLEERLDVGAHGDSREAAEAAVGKSRKSRKSMEEAQDGELRGNSAVSRGGESGSGGGGAAPRKSKGGATPEKRRAPAR